MANALIIRQAQLTRLYENIENNSGRYVHEKPWLAEYFDRDEWALPSTIDIAAEITLVDPISKTDQQDLANVRSLYTALHHISPVQAIDDRFWAYLTHVTFWTYMRKRWPAEQYSASRRYKENMQERYLFMPDRSRALLRNGIARLWWIGYSSFDSERSDPFELTAVLLKNLDVTQSITERAFSRNPIVTRGILTALSELELAGRPFYVREKIRDLVKYLVQIGGVTIIDALSATEIRELVLRKIDQLADGQQAAQAK
jgi:hypothetical protein